MYQTLFYPITYSSNIMCMIPGIFSENYLASDIIV